MANALARGAPRLLGKHATPSDRVWFRECYDALLEEFGGSLSGLSRLEAGRVAVAWVEFRRATRAVEDAKMRRATGRGRRPKDRDIERLARRLGLADATYSAALAALRALATAKRAPVPLTDLVAQAAQVEQQQGREEFFDPTAAARAAARARTRLRIREANSTRFLARGASREPAPVETTEPAPGAGSL